MGSLIIFQAVGLWFSMFMHTCFQSSSKFWVPGEEISKATQKTQPDQMETQAIDVMAAATPAEPSTMISPDHSAEAKRAIYQSKGEAIAAATPQPIAPATQAPAAKPEPPPEANKKLEEFTESDGEASYSFFFDCISIADSAL